jgi:hypothetical protein
VADGAGTFKAIQAGLIERLGNMAHGPFQAQFSAIRRYDAARFLTAMLQGIQAQIAETRSIGVAMNSEHATLFAKLVQLYIPVGVSGSADILSGVLLPLVP